MESIFTPTYKQDKWEGEVKGCLATVKVRSSENGMKQEKLTVLKKNEENILMTRKI